jgi:large repetitive protein
MKRITTRCRQWSLLLACFAMSQVAFSQTAAITISGGTNSICEGTSVTFTATATGGTAASYVWKKGGVAIVPAATNATYTTNTLVNGDAITCTITTTSPAATPTSNPVTMAVEMPAILTLSSTALCKGSSLRVTLGAGSTQTAISWKNNGVQVATGSAPGSPNGGGPTTGYATTAGGTHTATVTTAGGCTINSINSAFVSDVQIAPLTAGVIVSGGTTPVTVNVTGGAVPYSYSLDGGVYAATNSIAIGSGVHSVTVKDNANCNATSNIVTIGEVQIAATKTLICAGTSVTFTATPIVALPNPRYQWKKNGTNVGTNSTTYTTAGLAHNDVVTCVMTNSSADPDIIGTPTSNPITMSVEMQPTLALTPSPTCLGDAVTATLSNGNIKSIDWKNNGTSVFNEPNVAGMPLSTPYTTAAAGSHTATVNTVAGCTVNSNTISVLDVMVSTSVGTIACNGGTTTFTATPSGGLGGAAISNYTYSFDGAAFQNSNVATVGAGIHSVVVKDMISNCTESATVNVTEPSVVSISAPTAGTIICNGGSTSFSATASGGTTPYQYSVDGGTLQSSGFFLVQAGNHSIMVRDAGGCTATSSSVTISQPIPVALSTPVVGAISCNGGTTSLSTTANDGVAPYEYKLNSGIYQPSNVFTASAGLNTVTTRDANGCMQNVSVTLTEPTAITNTIASGNIACNGSTTTITATATGGTGVLQYSIDGINYQAANTFTKPAGTYAVTAKDANGCTRLSNSLTIGQPAALAVSIAPAATIPSNGTTTLTATATGGTTPYTYSVNGGAFQAANTFTVPSGRDSVVAKDMNGCTQLSSTVIIPNMVVSATKMLLCAGVSDTFRATPTNGGATPMYQWKKNNVNVGTNAAMYVDAGLVNGDVVRCDMTASAPSYAMTVLGNSITVTVETQPTATITPNSSCMGTPITATLSNGAFGSAIWKNNGTVIAGAATATYTSTAGGSHTATITTVAGCVVTSSAAAVYQVALTINNGNPVKVLCNGGTAGISAVASGGVAPYQYSLDGGSFSPNGLFTVNAGTYTITGKDANGCTKVTTVVVTEPAALTVDNPIAWPIACYGGTTVLSASARGGNYVYQYSLDGFNYQSTINFTVIAGTYQVIVRDSNGCSAASSLVTIGQPGDLIPTATQTTIACIGGTATVTMGTQGGTAPFSYSFNGRPFGTNRVFTGLTAGTYTLSVIDTNLCTKTVNYTVVQPTAVNGSLKVDTIICLNTNTQIVVTGTGGTGALSYSLNGGTPQGNTFTVEGGTYNVVISDVNGCKKTLPPVTVKYAATWTGNTMALPINCLKQGLLSAYPNPANEAVTIDFKIPSKSVVVLKIYNMMGGLIQTMDQGTLKGGSYTSRWSTDDLDNATVLICLEVDGVCVKNQKVRIIKR